MVCFKTNVQNKKNEGSSQSVEYANAMLSPISRGVINAITCNDLKIQNRIS